MGFAALVRRDVAVHSNERHTESCDDDDALSLELAPACESSAACLTDDRRKRRFLEPRRSDRILQHELTHGHDLTGCLAPLPLGTRRPDVVHGRRSRRNANERHVESRVDLRDCPDEPSRAHPPCALLDGVALERVGSLTQETVAEPQPISSKNPRCYLHSDEDTCGISTAAARAEGSKRRTGTFHPAFCEVFDASSPPRKPPNTLLSPVQGVRLLEWRFARCPTGRDPRSGDTPRRMARFRRPGCLDPLLGHDGRGDCSPEDRSSLGLRLTASDRPLSDAVL